MYSTPESQPAHDITNEQTSYRTPGRARRVRTGVLAAAMALAAAAATGGGCQWQPARPTEPSNPPILVDEAMGYRQWELSTARWVDSSMEGWPTRFPYTYETNSQQRRQYAPYVLDSLAFVFQVFRVPFTYIRTAPFASKTYTAVEYEPTYTAIGRFMPESGAYVIDRGNAAAQAADATDSSSATPGDATGGTPGAGTPGVGGPGTGAPGSVTPEGGTGAGTSGVPGGRPLGGTGTPGGAGGTDNTGGTGTGTGTGAGGAGTGAGGAGGSR